MLKLLGDRDDLVLNELVDGVEDLLLDVSQAIGLGKASHLVPFDLCQSGGGSPLRARHEALRKVCAHAGR
ncbi:hypothetical protein Back2_07840 [Nocardioides baekrokdamisoli]|uniref:Uncharacterized protein n=1 Tax=Nocardioides baekrokdamisoli TaxID=1804624 RepID=A0A3G9IC66_9ACTN|nr:hypothetical protein Back2_07840 [Nocardioides baekrokdamisoli]